MLESAGYMALVVMAWAIAAGSGVFARDPDAMLDMTELVPTDAIRQQLHNKAACRVIRAMLDKWCFLPEGHPDGAWRTSKPDTDNLEKALKDEMTRLHFWADDAQVCSEIVEKFWSSPCGVFVMVEELE